ncbi:MAG: RNA-binding transcriptional accessory protein [Clostridiales bacterium]|nr:RNA-binding transcriptional accessory protein [Clostridiales bacterium]
MNIIKHLSDEFNIKQQYVKNIINLIDDQNTIPFIARYRKEQTGSCDDQVLRELSDRLTYLKNLEKRKEDIIESITDQDKMTDKLMAAIKNATTMSEVEDIYRPYKKKRRTRAMVAKEAGLEPLAEIIFKQDMMSGNIDDIAKEYLDAQKNVSTIEETLAGAKDIIAEKVSDDAQIRKELRTLTNKQGIIEVRGKDGDESVYQMYYDYDEPASKIPSYRILAINRGEKESHLKVKIKVEEENVLYKLNNKFVKNASITTGYVKEAVKDSWDRLIKPSIEREVRNELTAHANEHAISMFALNLKPLLLQPPIKNKVTLGLDPAYRTGCKIAVVDGTGRVLDTTVIYPTPPANKIDDAKKKIKELIAKHNVSVISIGNGTASKESEMFVAELIGEVNKSLQYMVVNESGASVYSASKLAAKEFPEYDVSIRSAISIARRLQDPLAELVKIDPKSIGVGQYQHDMPKAGLDTALGGVVEDCVNAVGVDINTASVSLLSHISGLNTTVAQNVVAYRDEIGCFRNRKELKKVPRLGNKAYEQCAGFLRIPDGKNILDNTSVHPESYEASKKLLNLFDYKLSDIANDGLKNLPQDIKQMGKENTANACDIGLPTLDDITNELLKPGRDIRDELPAPILRCDIMNMSDLKEGMELTGTVRNVIDFGAFVDIGVHQDGLVHISQLSNSFVKHPSDVVKVGDVVKVRILSVDEDKKRISLSMK